MRCGRLLAGALILASAACSGDSANPSGFGFDWLQPETARCEKVTAELARQFQSCTFESEGGFGLSDPLHACRVNGDSEMMVFETEAICLRNLEAMQSNAP